MGRYSCSDYGDIILNRFAGATMTFVRTTSLEERLRRGRRGGLPVLGLHA